MFHSDGWNHAALGVVRRRLRGCAFYICVDFEFHVMNPPSDKSLIAYLCETIGYRYVAIFSNAEVLTLC